MRQKSGNHRINRNYPYGNQFGLFLRGKNPWVKNTPVETLIKGWLLLAKAKIHTSTSNMDKAVCALSQVKMLGPLPAGLEQEYLLARCNLYNQFNCLDELNEYLTKLESLAEMAGSQIIRAQCLFYRASLEASGGDYEKAMGFYLDALRTRESRGDRDFMAEIYNDLGFCARRLGNAGQGEEYYKISLKLRRDTGNLTAQAESLNNLGLHYMMVNQYQKAEEALQEAYNLEVITGDKVGEGYTLLNLGVLAFNRSEFSRAQKYYRRALFLRQSIGDNLGQGYCYYQLANLSLLLETPDAAFQNADRGRRCFSLAGDTYGAIKMDTLLCDILLEQGKTEQTEGILNKAALNDKTASQQHKLFLIPRLKLALGLGRGDQAEKLWLEYIGQDPGYSEKLEGMLVHGEMLACLGQKDLARERWKQALLKAEQKVLIYEKARILWRLGSLEPETTAGRKTLNEALGLFKNIGAPYWEQKIKNLLNREQI